MTDRYNTLVTMELAALRARDRIRREMNFQVSDQFTRAFDIFADELYKMRKEHEHD